MKDKKTVILTTIICIIPVIVGIVLYDRLPDEMITHWDVNGVSNGWESKFVAAIVFPASLAVINLLVQPLMRIDPKYENMGEKLKLLVQWIVPAVALFASGSTFAAALGIDVKVQLITPLFLGALFVMIGNYLPKTKQSYTLGIKLPWTLDDEDNWNRTHRMAGFLWVVCGLLMIIGAFFKAKNWMFIALFAIMVIVPTAYSFFTRKK